MRRSRAAERGAVSALLATLVLVGCTDEPGSGEQERSGGPSAATASGAMGVRDLFCPGDQPTVSAPLSGLDEAAAAFEAYLLDPEGNRGSDESSGTYCLQVALLDVLESAPTRISIAAPANPANYGESYTTSVARGSEEISYFPFAVGVYEGCRPVTATVTLADESVHRAQLRIGTGCTTR